MLNIRKILSAGAAVVLCIGALTGCNGTDDDSGSGGSAVAGKSITVVSREEGSGTRDAFTELLGITEEDASGEDVDNTTVDAEITNSTAVMMTTVRGNTAAIGYISLGSLNDDVKAIKVDGAEATAENIKNGTYKVSRPLNIVTRDDTSEAASDFIQFIMSSEGQRVVEDKGYVSTDSGEGYTASGIEGKIVVAGSSSVAPLMEALAENYMALNSGVTINVEQNDSTTGVNSTVDGICDIGMASRDLKDSETAKGVSAATIAMDGIAVIVNSENPIEALDADTIRDIYVGDITEWDDVEA